MKRTSKAELYSLVQSAGLFMFTWAPGDGITRYRFHTSPDQHTDPIFTALSTREGIVFLRGYSWGRGHSLRVERGEQQEPAVE